MWFAAVNVGDTFPPSCTLPRLVLLFGYDKSHTPGSFISIYPFLVGLGIYILGSVLPTPIVVNVGAILSVA